MLYMFIRKLEKNYNAGLVYETVSALLRLLAPFVPARNRRIVAWRSPTLTAACMHKAGLKPRQRP